MCKATKGIQVVMYPNASSLLKGPVKSEKKLDLKITLVIIVNPIITLIV